MSEDRGGVGAGGGYLTAYQVIEIKARGRCQTKHVPLDEVQGKRRAVTSDLQPTRILGEVRELTSTSAFGVFSPEGEISNLMRMDWQARRKWLMTP